MTGLGLLLLAAGPAAAPAQAPPDGQPAEIVVEGRRPIVVTAATCPEPDPLRYPDRGAPSVVDSFPRPGSRPAPGYLRVRIRFDQPMSCFSEVVVDGGEGRPCRPDGAWSLPERRDFSMVCRFPPATAVRLRFQRVDGEGFVALSGRRAAPYRLDFTTGEGPASETLDVAERADPGPPTSPVPDRPSIGAVVCEDPGPAATRREKDCRRQGSPPPDPLRPPG